MEAIEVPSCHLTMTWVKLTRRITSRDSESVNCIFSFHTQMRLYGICLSVPDLTDSQGIKFPSMLSQIPGRNHILKNFKMVRVKDKH